MEVDQRFELADQPRVLADREPGIDSQLGRLQAQLLEPRHLTLGEGLLGEVGQRRPPPQRDGLQQQLARGDAVPLGHRGVRAPQETREPERVELRLTDPEDVSRRLGQKKSVPERLAQPRHVHLDHVAGAGRGRLAPDLPDQTVARDHLVRGQQQHRQQSPLPIRAELDRPPVTPHLQRAQNPELRRRGHVARHGSSRGDHVRARGRHRSGDVGLPLCERRSRLKIVVDARAARATTHTKRKREHDEHPDDRARTAGHAGAG